MASAAGFAVRRADWQDDGAALRDDGRPLITARLRADNERLVGELVRGDLG